VGSEDAHVVSATGAAAQAGQYWDSGRDDRLICRAIIDENGPAKTISFSPATLCRFAFEPGQYLVFTFETEDGPIERCYSISSSAANEHCISITVKLVPGGRASTWLAAHLRVGDVVHAHGPLGNFSAGRSPAKMLLFLSAGSGITPIASMMRTFADFCADVDVTSIHWSRTPDSTIFAEEMPLWARRVPSARLFLSTTSSETPAKGCEFFGRISAQQIEATVPDIAQRTVYCCGPAGFMADARRLVLGLGLPSSAYHEESFDFAIEKSDPAAQAPAEFGATTHAGFAVHFSKSGRTIQCPQDTTLLRAASAERLPIPSSCRKGVCGTCRTRLVSGTVEMKNGGGLRQRDIDQGWILPCCSKPTSPVVLDR
jgi:ferredoxin-NADP reductase